MVASNHSHRRLEVDATRSLRGAARYQIILPTKGMKMSTYSGLIRRGQKVFDNREAIVDSVEWKLYQAIGVVDRRVVRQVRHSLNQFWARLH
jgi:hypothetical protein